MKEKDVINTDREKLSTLTTPLSGRGLPRWLVFVTGFIGLLYLLNPTAGVLEIIPDVIPFVGNLDEGVAAVLIWYAVVEFFEGRK